MNLRVAQKELTRRLLLEKGLERFESDGYAATTIEDIAVAAGTTRATFYQHFPSKAALMSSLVRTTDELFTGTDVPSLRDVVAGGEPAAVAQWLGRKLGQWSEVRPYLTAVYQAAADPEVYAIVEQWHDATVTAMVRGLEIADRFDPATRRVRCVLAFGELESLSRRWMRRGLSVELAVAHGQMSQSWCHLLLD
jgi:AcrR family transcriptional regulator